MDKVIRWGILGTGQIARALAFALQEVAGAKLVAVASRDSAGAERFGDEFGIARRHGSYQALADDAGVDVIYIATPHALHAEHALLCLNAGKHVLCEKTFAVNRREAAQMVALARAKNLFLMEAMWSRFLPAIGEARRIVASGEIGQVAQIQSDFGFAPGPGVGAEHRLLNLELGGGALLDIGIYPLSLSAFFLGPVEAVQAVAEFGPTGVDLQTAFSLRHQGGGLASCVCGIRAQTPTEMTICGTLGRLRLHGRFFQAQTLTIDMADGEARTVEFPHIGSGYAYQLVEVMRCLRAGLIESPLMPLDETLALMGVLDTIRAQIGLAYGADQIQP